MLRLNAQGNTPAIAEIFDVMRYSKSHNSDAGADGLGALWESAGARGNGKKQTCNT